MEFKFKQGVRKHCTFLEITFSDPKIGTRKDRLFEEFYGHEIFGILTNQTKGKIKDAILIKNILEEVYINKPKNVFDYVYENCSKTFSDYIDRISSKDNYVRITEIKITAFNEFGDEYEYIIFEQDLTENEEVQIGNEEQVEQWVEDILTYNDCHAGPDSKTNCSCNEEICEDEFNAKEEIGYVVKYCEYLAEHIQEVSDKLDKILNEEKPKVTCSPELKGKLAKRFQSPQQEF